MKISTLDDDYDLNEREEKEDVNEWENGDGTIKNNIREGKKSFKALFYYDAVTCYAGWNFCSDDNDDGIKSEIF